MRRENHGQIRHSLAIKEEAMSKTFGACVLVAAIVAAGTAGFVAGHVVQAQEKFGVQDYIDIQNLYSTYTRFTDMGGEGDGSDYASLFTSDGEVATNTGSASIKGTDALKKMIKGFHGQLQKNGWSSRHTYSNLVITPTPDGAKGSVYFMVFNVTAEPPVVDHSGLAEDWLVKTKDGWKFKKRLAHPSASFKPSMRRGMDEIFHR